MHETTWGQVPAAQVATHAATSLPARSPSLVHHRRIATMHGPPSCHTPDLKHMHNSLTAGRMCTGSGVSRSSPQHAYIHLACQTTGMHTPIQPLPPQITDPTTCSAQSTYPSPHTLHHTLHTHTTPHTLSSHPHITPVPHTRPAGSRHRRCSRSTVSPRPPGVTPPCASPAPAACRCTPHTPPLSPWKMERGGGGHK